MRTPEPLNQDDKVRIVAASGGLQIFPATLRRGVSRLESLGLEVEVDETVEKDTDWLNSNAKKKAEALMDAFEDRSVGGVIAATGGDEQIRLLRHLNPRRMERNPTRFYGISDNTCLTTYLWNLGMTSFYGGQVLADLQPAEELWDYTSKYLQRALFDESLGIVPPSENFSDGFCDLEGSVTDDRKRYQTEWMWEGFSGKVSGRLFGGCFEVLTWLISTDRAPSAERLEGDILFVETSEESPSPDYVRRWLNCMGENGWLEAVDAVIVGRPMRSPLGKHRSTEEKREYARKQRKEFRRSLERYSPVTPILFDVDAGHTDPKAPLEIGGRATLNPRENHINFE